MFSQANCQFALHNVYNYNEIRQKNLSKLNTISFKNCINNYTLTFVIHLNLCLQRGHVFVF